MSARTRCARCRRPILDSADNDRWFALSLTAHVRPECQTFEERNVVDEVQTMYRVLDRGGVIFTPALPDAGVRKG